MAKKPNSSRKRNPQDATRARDVAPLRRRVETLERESRELWTLLARTSKALDIAVKKIAKLEALVG